MRATSLEQLERDALAVRRAFVKMHYEAKAGHIGSGLSSMDLLIYLHGKWLRDEDQFILSKGHGASSLYATLHHYGQISDEQFLQGPLSDAMTHAGQLAMLRRLAGSPVASENFIFAKVDAANVSSDQAEPAAPDPWWKPNQPPPLPGPGNPFG